jgi:dTDP-glucose pyrophosphorylase
MLNVLIPMAGRGQRFRDAGYQLPKPLIQINNKCMIQMVVENLDLDGKFIFLVLKEHYINFDLQNMLKKICKNNYEIVIVDQITEGAACTCLLAEKFIDNNDELIIANSDQLVDWSSSDFLNIMHTKNADGGIITFADTNPKWSFAKIDPATNLVVQVAEKQPISDRATAGIYWFRQGSDFVQGAKQMISQNIRTNNEFYVCPIFNELINTGKKIMEYPINKMMGLGTPEDLQYYLSNNNN